MPKGSGDYLNPREQQIMEIVYQRDAVTAAEVEELLPGSPSNSTVRTLLRILETKGYLTHAETGGRFVYRAIRPRVNAAKAALDTIVSTFFRGSVEQAFATLLSSRERDLTAEDLDRLSKLVEDAKAAAEGRSEQDGEVENV